jgi:putative tryptophan/tyrosine transport system substrate-binding protein
MNKSVFRFALSAMLLVLIYALCSSTHAQQPANVPRIGFLIPGTQAAFSVRTDAIRQGLRDLGYLEGKNLVIEFRYNDGKVGRLPELAAELAHLKVEVIFAVGSDAAQAAKSVTKTIPIVATAADPVGTKLVASLAQPGGNITRLSILSPELSGKRLDLLKETVPKISRIAVMLNSTTPNTQIDLKETEAAARSLRVQLHLMEVRRPDEIDGAFSATTKAGAGAFVVLTDPMLLANRTRIVNLAAKSRLPVMYYDSAFVDVGGLMSYGANINDLFRRAATYVDKILKGAKPADLPVEQPTKFEFIVNLKAAKQIGLTIPPNVLVRADRVIQ